ncbi:MAG: acetyl-CoA carboxylase biotin carboxyl carrier protein [Blastocatellia bacterium]|jgi:acetyl-CoA carboxylase biotin carboxyl carrier protein
MPIRERSIEGEPVTTGTTRAAEKSRTDLSGGEHLSLAEIRDLIELISEKQFNEFELEQGGFRLRLQKGTPRSGSEGGGREDSGGVSVPMAHPVTTSTSGSGAANAQPAAAPAPVAAQEEQLHVITSPIVGTFYRSPSPTSQAFVQPGDVVDIGRTVCIIEAMKLMNEIQADARGTIVRVYVENGQPVEYGQPLFGLKP